MQQLSARYHTPAFITPHEGGEGGKGLSKNTDSKVETPTVGDNSLDESMTLKSKSPYYLVSGSYNMST